MVDVYIYEHYSDIDPINVYENVSPSDARLIELNEVNAGHVVVISTHSPPSPTPF